MDKIISSQTLQFLQQTCRNKATNSEEASVF